jgi:hypothetical protein
MTEITSTLFHGTENSGVSKDKSVANYSFYEQCYLRKWRIEEGHL